MFFSLDNHSQELQLQLGVVFKVSFVGTFLKPMKPQPLVRFKLYCGGGISIKNMIMLDMLFLRFHLLVRIVNILITFISRHYHFVF